MIKFIYFDLGNTIVDYHSGPVTEREKEELGLEQMRTHLARAGSPASWEKIIDQFYTPLMKELMPMRAYNSAEPDVESLAGRLIQGKAVTSREIMNLFFEPVRRFAVCNYDIAPALEGLKEKGKRMGIISNTPIHGSSHEETLERLGLHLFFSHKLYSFDEGLRKPNRTLFMKAADLTGCAMDEIMMVGDNPAVDLETPYSLGMKCLLFDPGKIHGEKKYPVIARFGEIQNHLTV